MDVWITEFELPDHETRIRGNNAEAEDEYDTSRRGSVWGRNFRVITDGTIPIAARTEGSDRIPSDTVSAIMTEQCECLSFFKASKAGIDTHAGLPGRKSAQHHPKKRKKEATDHHSIVLYLTSEFDSSPNGSSLSFEPALLLGSARPPSNSSLAFSLLS